MHKIHIITTGGTIDKVYFDALSEYQVGEPVIASVLERMGVNINYDVESVLRKDSLDITDEDRRMIVARVNAAESDRILITHGTDGMVETSKWLREGTAGKTVVLTGALQPAAFHTTDGIFNIGCALGAVQAAQAGIYITMNGELFNANNVVKNRTEGRFKHVQ